jgi:thiamine biosynthesis lipoprotein
MNKLIVRDKNFMNTTITIKVVKDDVNTTNILDAIEEAFGEFDRIVKKFTRFNENSELSNLNRQSGSWVKVSDEFLYLIEYSLKMSKLTDGAFDPTIIDFLEVYGYDKNYDFSKLDNPDLDKLVQKIATDRHDWSEIEIKGSEVKLAPGQRFDLGGIGKGYAIDCAYEKLDKFNNFLIDAGGDIRVKGKNEKSKLWKVALKHKNREGVVEIVGNVELNNESIASSGSWARQVKQFHHLINPKTGKPENKFRTVYVQAKTGIESDSFGTAIFVGGEKVLSIVPENIKYFFIS